MDYVVAFAQLLDTVEPAFETVPVSVVASSFTNSVDASGASIEDFLVEDAGIVVLEDELLLDDDSWVLEVAEGNTDLALEEDDAVPTAL